MLMELQFVENLEEPRDEMSLFLFRLVESGSTLRLLIPRLSPAEVRLLVTDW